MKGLDMKEEVQAELVEIYNRDGALNPEEVIATASDKATALHSHFQWDNSIAGHQFRLEQARKLIRVAVTVIPSISNSPVKQFVSITSLRGSDGGSYIATADLLSDEDKYELAVYDAIRSLERLRYQYTYIRELGPVWTAIDKAIAKIRPKKAA